MSVFNTYFGITGIQFLGNKITNWHIKQLCGCNFFYVRIIPIILFFLALSLTGYLPIAWITAWISVFHIGLILASLFLLTEGLTLIFFYLFLLFFYRSFTTYGSAVNAQHWIKNISIAALLLGISSWLRPMGLFVSVASALLLLLIARDSIKLKLKKISLFFLVFFACLSPWYIRNYQLTGKLFFCPMFGTYLNCFIAPKIIRETHKMPLLESWTLMQNKVQQEAMPQALKAQAAGKVFVADYCAAAVAWPLVLQHPGISAYFWIKESLKTAFDVYSYQLVAIAKESWKWDPLEEHLFQKVAEGLYTQPLPVWIRIIFWLDLSIL